MRRISFPYVIERDFRREDGASASKIALNGVLYHDIKIMGISAPNLKGDSPRTYSVATGQGADAG
jgi:hypothetical protein